MPWLGYCANEHLRRCIMYECHHVERVSAHDAMWRHFAGECGAPPTACDVVPATDDHYEAFFERVEKVITDTDGEQWDAPDLVTLRPMTRGGIAARARRVGVSTREYEALANAYGLGMDTTDAGAVYDAVDMHLARLATCPQ